MTWSRNIAMTRFLEHCDESAWSIVIKGDKEHCDMGRELCDDSGHGVLCWARKGTRGFVTHCKEHRFHSKCNRKLLAGF